MNVLRRRFRPCLEHLESRDTPSNLTVTFANDTLTIKGDTDNTLTVAENGADEFTISSSGSDTFNGNPSPFTSSTGVENITFSLSGDGDAVDFDGTSSHGIGLKGGVTVDTGNGGNGVSATDLGVKQNIAITNGANSTGVITNSLTNLEVGGNVTIKDGNGDTSTTIARSDAGVSSIVGSVSITNGTGEADNTITDTNVGGNVTVANGHAGSNGDAGFTQISNHFNTSFPLVIKGNVSVSYGSGNGTSGDGLWDAFVEGNVSFNHGSGNFTTNFDGDVTPTVVEIGGNLTLSGTGDNTVTVGTEFMQTGLVVAKNLTITGSGADTLTFHRLQVNGTTKLTLGNVANNVAINDSLFGGSTAVSLGNGANLMTIDGTAFAGTVNLTTGKGVTEIEVEDTTGDTSPTVFDKAVSIKYGSGANVSELAETDFVTILSTFVVTGTVTSTEDAANLLFPFGNSIT